MNPRRYHRARMHLEVITDPGGLCFLKVHRLDPIRQLHYLSLKPLNRFAVARDGTLGVLPVPRHVLQSIEHEKAKRETAKP